MTSPRALKQIALEDKIIYQAAVQENRFVFFTFFPLVVFYFSHAAAHMNILYQSEVVRFHLTQIC